MTNYEYLTGPRDVEEMADFLCDLIDNPDFPLSIHCCDFCVAKEHCCIGHKGFIDWLMEEHKE